MLIGSPLLPYSPRWLIQKGRNAEALAVLRKLHKMKDESHDEYARREYIQMVKQTEHDSAMRKDLGRFAILKTRPNRHRVLLAIVIMWGAQFTGVWVLGTYGVYLYTSLGMTGSKPLLLYALWCTITIPGNTFTALFIDKIGRRTLMLIGITGILISLICEAALQAQYLGTDNVAGQGAAIFFLFFFIFPWWCGCMDATIYVYLSEIFPSYLRSQGQSIGMGSFAICVMIALVAAPIGLANIGWRFFMVFISCTFVFYLCLWFIFPETRQMSIEDLNETFGDTVVMHFHGATDEELREYEKEIQRELQEEEGAVRVVTPPKEKAVPVHVEDTDHIEQLAAR